MPKLKMMDEKRVQGFHGVDVMDLRKEKLKENLDGVEGLKHSEGDDSIEDELGISAYQN